MSLEHAGFFDVFSISRGEMLLDLVYQHQSASEVSSIAHIVGGKRHGKIRSRFGLKKPTPFPSRPPTFLFVLLGRAT